MPMNGFKGDGFKGKMKGKEMMGMAALGMGMPVGMAYGKGKPSRDEHSAKGSGRGSTAENIDMLSLAVGSLPASLSADRSQLLQFNCLAGYVSALIGKAGQGTKQIATQTDTKIMIREIDQNPNEKCVVIKGNVINVASAARSGRPWQTKI